MRASFSGMAAWDFGSDMVECDTPAGSVDLHNTSTLEEIELACVPRPTVSFLFHDDAARRFRLSFLSVSELQIVQDADSWLSDWDPEEVETVRGFDYFEDGDDLAPRFEVQTAVASVTFRARGVLFEFLAP